MTTGSTARTAQHSGQIDPIRRLLGALDAADRTLDRLHAFETRDPDRVPAPKVVAEAALLVYCAHRVVGLDATLARRVGVLARRLAPLARGADVVAGICMEPALALDHAAAHVLLGRVGESDARVDRLLDVALQTKQFVERMPHRVLEQAWLSRLYALGASTRATLALRVSPGSAIDHPIDVLASNRLDAYAFTHAAMYATDIGRDPLALPRSTTAIAAELSALLAFALENDDFDLAAELGLCWPMLRLPDDPACALALDVLRDKEDRLGFVHGRRFDPAHHAELTPAAREDYEIATSYHTRFVVGMLHATLLATPPRGAVVPTPRPLPARAADALFDRLPARHPEPVWRNVYASWAPEARAELAPFILAALLRDAHAAADLPRLRDALELGLELRVVDGPAPAQASALFKRCSLL